jgi:arylformamidase
MTSLYVEFEGRRFRTRDEVHDLSIPLRFADEQLECFGAPPAREQALEAGSFVGDVRRGGSCNCSTYTITAHCNGTHTECVGHITAERLSVRDLCTELFSVALLISVEPVPAGATSESTTPLPKSGDFIITRAALETAVRMLDSEFCPPESSRPELLQATSPRAAMPTRALVVRTMPNDESKRLRRYSEQPAAYFSAEAMQWIVAQGIEHLVVDLPSLDRAEDEGNLTAHRIFWNVPPRATSIESGTRRRATVTELAFVSDEVADGLYLLNLQVAPFAADAAPSRPMLTALIPE